MIVDAESITAKARLRRVAVELFARRGFHATGVARISEGVGLGKGALYHHMQSKESLLYEICFSRLEELLARAYSIVDSDAPPVDVLQSLACDLMRDLADHRLEWMVGLRETSALHAEHREKVVRARGDYERLWTNVFAEATDAGELLPTNHVLIMGILGLFNNSHLWMDADGPLAPEEIATIYLDLVLNGLRPR